ncbi:type I methionyl aminopeptidase [Candidatus Roizmanbacteria bacterium]|nr:type I methionyl aminopeptidase [Candidatus Roizmanbacteria bacterium]
MIKYKGDKEIALMREGGRRLRTVVAALIAWIHPGLTTDQIDQKARELIKKQGGEPSFTRVPGYRWVTCLPINEEVVHTPPSSRIVKNGDVLTVDIGMFFGGYHTDYADTFVAGKTNNSLITKFLAVGRVALIKAIASAKTGHYLGEISQAIENEIKAAGYFILKELTGHGVGRELHEDPFVPGYLNRPVKTTLKLTPGLALAIEVIYSQGTEKISYDSRDEWTIRSADGSLTACFEHTIVILADKTEVLT